VSEPSPQQQLAPMISGYWVSQMIYVAAKLELADHLAVGSKNANELAKLSGTHAPSLYRLLRALASVGIFSEDESFRFTLTPLADGLRKDAPGSQHALALMMGEEHYHCWGDLLESVRTGAVAFERLYGRPVFDYLSEHPDQAAIFDAAMTSIHGRETQAMLDAYDLADVKVLADVGGGNGTTLIGILHRNPQMRGILYDLQGVADRARSSIEASGLSGRCEVVSGSFFETVPSGVDAYLLRHIIHDWDDEKATAILRSVHNAMSLSAKLLVVESVVPPGDDPAFVKLLDLTMLLIPGGRERTAAEYRELYHASGFELVGITPTAADVSVIEGSRV
jgi:hypothetical protein